MSGFSEVFKNKSRRTASRGAIAALVLLMLLVRLHSAEASPQFDQAAKLYKQGKYAEAEVAFNKCTPKTSDIYYYLGLCSFNARKPREAAEYYRKAVTATPGSAASTLATLALSNLLSPSAAGAAPPPARPAGASATHAAEQSASESGDSQVFVNSPHQYSIPFTLDDKDIMIAAEVNGRKILMCLDTGAPDCWIGTNHLAELQISPPTGPHRKMQAQLGDNDYHKYWEAAYNLRIDVLNQAKFPFVVQENRSGPPLLGQTFLAPFEYSIDYGAKQLRLKKKSTSTASAANTGRSTHYELPFVKSDGYIKVQGEVDGHPCSLYFDTGAPDVCFSSAQCRKFGIEVHPDATHAVARRIKVGPIDKYNVRVSLIDSENMDMPLLGQEFYSDWQYTFDNVRSVIHFLRR